MKGRGRREIAMYTSVFHRFCGQRMKDKSEDGLLRESRRREGECWKRGRGWMYSTRGDDRRICETSLRKYAQLNFPTPMASPLPYPPLSRFRPLCEPPALSPACLPACLPASLPACLPLPRPSYVGPHLLRRPRILRPACCLCPLSRFDPSFFSVAAYFFCLASLALARGPLYLFHPPPSPPPASPARSLFCHGALVLALSHSICHPPLSPRRSIIPQSRGV